MQRPTKSTLRSLSKKGALDTLRKFLSKALPRKKRANSLRWSIRKYNFFISWFSGSGIFNEEAIDQDKLTIINFLQNEGYADANVDFNIIDGDSKGKVAIVIVANKGQLYHFGTISFEGNQLFQDSEIESVFLHVLKAFTLLRKSATQSSRSRTYMVAKGTSMPRCNMRPIWKKTRQCTMSIFASMKDKNIKLD